MRGVEQSLLLSWLVYLDLWALEKLDEPLSWKGAWEFSLAHDVKNGGDHIVGWCKLLLLSKVVGHREGQLDQRDGGRD